MFRSGFIVIALLLGVLYSPLAAQEDKAVPAELKQYVRDAQKAGLKPDQIRQNAVKVGWPPVTVDEALNELRASDPKPESPSGEKTADDKEGSAASFDPATKPVPLVENPSKPDRKPALPQDPPRNPAAAPSVAPGGDGPGKTLPEPAPDEYEIGEGDVLQISVWDEPTASVPAATVRADGKISLPLVKELMVAGLTPSQAEVMIQERLSKTIRDPIVAVIVSQINSKKVYLIGAVRKEGPLKYSYRMTVLQAISEAGGLTDYAKRKNIYILHNEGGRQYKLPFDYNAVLRGENMGQNSILSPGDTIVVPQ